MAGWGEDPERRTYAPVLLRAAHLRPRGHGEEDFDLDLAPATRINPVLVEHLRIEYGVPLDAGLLAELAAGQGTAADSFDPLPMLQRLAETCADIPRFRGPAPAGRRRLPRGRAGHGRRPRGARRRPWSGTRPSGC